MPGLYATVVGGLTIIALVIVGIWLTWISLRDVTHRPAALQTTEPDESE